MLSYQDKATGRTISLSPAAGEYLVKFKEGVQGESQLARFSQAEHFNYARWAPRDNLAVVKFNREAERARSVQGLLHEMRAGREAESITPALVDPEGFTRYAVPDRLLVAWQPGAGEAVASLLPAGSRLLEQGRFGSWAMVGLPAGMDIREALDHFNQLPEVRYCEPAYYGFNDAEQIGNGPLYWNLETIGLEEAWQISRGAAEVVVAVIDGSPDLTHPVFPDRTRSAVPEPPSFAPPDGISSHSTQICGLLAGDADSFRGICPGATLLPVVVQLTAQYYAQRAEAIHYLAQIRRDKRLNGQPVSQVVANCSWRTSGDIAVIREAIREAAAEGVFFVTSAGNDGHSGPHYPSDYSRTCNSVLSVAALAPSDRKAEYSNFSEAIDIAAPGGAGLPFDADDIYCPDVNDSFSFSAGTSLAAPHVAGVVALILAVAPELDATAVKDILRRSAFPLKEQNPNIWQLLGAGKLNAGQALRLTQASRPAEPVEPVTGPEPPPPPLPATGPRISISSTLPEKTAAVILQQTMPRLEEELRRLLAATGPNTLPRQLRVAMTLGERTTIIELPL